MKPRKRRANPEHRLQIAVAQYLAVALRPPTLWTSLDAGAGKMSPITAALRKARGVKPGWPDLLIIHPGRMPHMATVLGIELKAGKGKPSPAQNEIGAAMRAAGGDYAVCRSIDEVADALAFWDIPLHARPA